MKHRFLHILTCCVCCCVTAALFSACASDDSQPKAGDLSMGSASVTLTGLSDAAAGFDVQLRNTSTGSIFIEKTDAQGTATFRVTPGIYEASVTAAHSSEGIAYTYNGTSGQITVRRNQTTPVTIQMKSARISQLVIKELYNGGCLMDDGITKFQYDKCVVLYNNSSQPASLSNLCFGECTPANAHQNNKNYGDDGRLTYESEGFIPVWNGIWYFPQALELAPYSQVVVNIHGAIDNTQAVSQSVDYANPAYYCMYDPESGYNNTGYYPTPSDVIPTSHYLKAVEYGLGNGWALSVSAPAFVMFQTHGISPADYATNTANIWYDGGNVSQVWACLKVPNEWIVDALEVYSTGYKDSSLKRLTADIDAGYVWLTNYQGHTLYRNVNKEATEALLENAGRLVYGYDMGVDGVTDPSGIDAEASIRHGAHIIYQDTNNSTNDFHERQRCSLRVTPLNSKE